MRFRRNVPDENREFLKTQLKQYKQEMTMTKEEIRDLENWVASGRSPYDNGDFICTEGGWPMDYISARRFLAEEYERIQGLSEAEREQKLRGIGIVYNTEAEDIGFTAGELDCQLNEEDELPFN